MSKTRNEKKKIYGKMYYKHGDKPREYKERAVGTEQRQHAAGAEDCRQSAINNIIRESYTDTVKEVGQGRDCRYKPRQKRQYVQQHRKKVQQIPKDIIENII